MRTQFTNPQIRLPIRTDFPAIGHVNDIQRAVYLLETESQKKIGKKHPERIIVAFPQKNPAIKNYSNGAPPLAKEFAKKLHVALPNVSLYLANELVERRRLYRSDTGIDARFERPQRYTLVRKLQTSDTTLVKAQNEGAPYILVDDIVDHGSTLADMASYITHNGGHVLFAAVADFIGTKYLSQRKMQKSKLGRVFSQSARESGVEMSPAECLALVEKHLNARGYSINSMASGECSQIIRMIETADVRITFAQFLKSIGGQLPEPSSRSVSRFQAESASAFVFQ